MTTIAVAHPTKEFRVVQISVNRGSFGHNQMVLVARDGEAHRVMHIQGGGHDVWTQGQILKIPRSGNSCMWALIGVECPHEMERAPKAVIDMVWDDNFPASAMKR